MAAPDQTPKPSAIDPDDVPETLCDGNFNVYVAGNLATITFTHWRPKVPPLFERGQFEFEAVVRARITTSVDNLVSLRDVLNGMIQNPGQTSGAAGGGRPLH